VAGSVNKNPPAKPVDFYYFSFPLIAQHIDRETRFKRRIKAKNNDCVCQEKS
jgi:hypothetical protein